MGIRLYLTFYNCVTASENAYATSSFGYSRDKVLVFNYWLFIYSSIQLLLTPTYDHLQVRSYHKTK